jgi:hypothetical protein
MSTTTQRPYRMHAGERHPCWILRPRNPLPKCCTVDTHRSSRPANGSAAGVRAWSVVGRCPPPPRKCLQKRARIVRAKRVRTRPFVGSPVLRPASGPRRRRYDEGMMKCPPVQGLPRWRVDPWNASGPAVVWPRNPPRCSEALTARNGAEHPRAPSAVLLPSIAMLPARQQCPAWRLETDSSGRALGGPHYGAAAGYARAIPISNALEHSIGRARAGIRE